MTAPVSLRIGRNMLSVEYTSDPTDRASRIAAIAAEHAGGKTFLGLARFRATATDSGAKTIVLEDPEGGGPIGFDNQFVLPVKWYLLRERTAETFRIEASVTLTQTLTLLTWPSLDIDDGEFFQFRRTEPGTGLVGSGNGMVPHYLDHPLYAVAPPIGIGVKFRAINRDEIVGLPTLNRNALLRQWSNLSNLPDGWTWSVRDDGVATDPSVGNAFTFSRNTDPLYQQSGGQSMQFSATRGALYTPPFPWVPTYAGERMSARFQLYLTQFGHPIADFMYVTLGVRMADGTFHHWLSLTNDQSTLVVRPQVSTAPGKYEKVGTNGWVSIGFNGLDITVESDNTANFYRITAADLAALPAGDVEGFSAMLFFQPATRIEGYLDAGMVVRSGESPSEYSEYGGANALWRDAQYFLDKLGQRQVTIAGEGYDLYRMNPTLPEADRIARGKTAHVELVDLGPGRVVQRFTDVTRNERKEGDIKFVLSSNERKLIDLLLGNTDRSSSSTRTGTAGSGTTSGGGTIVTPGTGGGGGTGAPTIGLYYVLDANSVPTVYANVSSDVTVVRFASTYTAPGPTDAETRLGLVDNTAPFQMTFGAVPEHTTLYVSAFAYTSTGTESAKATIPIANGTQGDAFQGANARLTNLDLLSVYQPAPNRARLTNLDVVTVHETLPNRARLTNLDLIVVYEP